MNAVRTEEERQDSMNAVRTEGKRQDSMNAVRTEKKAGCVGTAFMLFEKEDSDIERRKKVYNIGFPNLNLYFNINPVAFSIGNVSVYWYGIFIAFAVLLGLLLARKDSGKFGVYYNDVEEFILWAIPVSVIFARLYYVIFSWEAYRSQPLKIFAVWEGGLAIYGGIIGAVLTALVYCKVKKIKLWDLLDYCVPYLALGQCIGRWGNFTNREAYGFETDSFFRMELLQGNGEYLSVHPTFFYESVGMLLIFLLLSFSGRKFSGEKTAMYFLCYGILRAVVEWFRADSLLLNGWKVSMVLSIVLSVISLIVLVKNRRKKEPAQ
ncbi:MAG: prolipoprotein diacylglyceryl transferase [Clostridia bacterium]|nr:prolipoprotein diacylglyceryl transferase [Clostridia bacterium]